MLTFNLVLPNTDPIFFALKTPIRQRTGTLLGSFFRRVRLYPRDGTDVDWRSESCRPRVVPNAGLPAASRRNVGVARTSAFEVRGF